MLAVVRTTVALLAAAVTAAAEAVPQLRGTDVGAAAAGADGVAPASLGRLVAGLAAQAVQQQRLLVFGAASLERSRAGGAGARRLQSAALCAWSNKTGQCSVSNAYAAEKLASMPADSPVRALWQGEMVCGRAADAQACARVGNCSWDVADKQCVVSLSAEAQARLLGLSADPTSCGVLGAMFSGAQCSGLDAVKCQATAGCALVDGQALGPAGTCAKAQVCAPSDDSVSSLASQLCPAANVTCRADDMCLAKVCPAYARVHSAAAEVAARASPACSSFGSYETCYWGSNERNETNGTNLTNETNETDANVDTEMCTWNEDKEVCESGAPVSSWQVLWALMQDVPDSCTLKGVLTKAAECASVGVSCTGDCTWEMTKRCDDVGTLDTEEVCTVSVDFVLRSIASRATEQGNKGVDLLLQADTACAAKTGQSDCLGIPRPEGVGVGNTSGALRIVMGALPALAAALAVAVSST